MLTLNDLILAGLSLSVVSRNTDIFNSRATINWIMTETLLFGVEKVKQLEIYYRNPQNCSVLVIYFKSEGYLERFHDCQWCTDIWLHQNLFQKKRRRQRNHGYQPKAHIWLNSGNLHRKDIRIIIILKTTIHEEILLN